MLKQEGKGSLVVLLLAERARSEGARSMRAVKGSLGHSFQERGGEFKGFHSTRALEDQPGFPVKRDLRKVGDMGSGTC